MTRGHSQALPSFRPSPVPKDLSPSAFVVSCLKHLSRSRVGIAADLGAGYGRHSRLLAAIGYTVFAIDLDHRALRTLPTGPTYERQGRIIPVLADVSSELPLSHEALDLALAVHCSVHDHLSAIEAALAPGGLLIYETFGGQGRNWQELPKGGQLRSTLKSRFEILELHERRVGPAGKGHVAVKVFARKQGI